MTEFEQRVAEALEHAHGGHLVYGDSVADVQACASCQQLAPRVAAALEIAVKRTENQLLLGLGMQENWRPVALAALQGEPT